MKRITPEQVLEAYRVTGAKPITHMFALKSPAGWCCCGMGVLYAAKGLRTEQIMPAIEDDFDNDYMTGFSAGFTDGSKGVHSKQHRGLLGRAQEGYIDAQSCASAVFG